MNTTTINPVLISCREAQPDTDNSNHLPALNCDITSGKIVCFTGLHRSSQLPYMQMLAGLTPPLSGELKLLENEQPPDDGQTQSLLRQKIGFVLQGGPLLSVLNGIENLKLAARYHEVGDEKFIDDKAKELMSKMPHKKDQQSLPAYMSKLLRRHIAIARPLMLDPKVIILDNPFEGLSYYDKSVVAEYMAGIVLNQKVTLILNTDDLFFIRKYADQIIFCDSLDTVVFKDWKSFNQYQSDELALLFEYQNTKK